MLLHNLTIALRNLKKYKTQSYVSILGLAAGFACFSLTAMWIRYENSFDRFHPKGDRIFQIVFEWKDGTGGMIRYMNSEDVSYFKANFPEVEDVSIAGGGKLRAGFKLSGNGDNYEGISVTMVDSSFIKMFDLPHELISQLQRSSSGRYPIAISMSESDKVSRKGDNPIGMISNPIKPNDPQNYSFYARYDGSSNNASETVQLEIKSMLPKWNRTDFLIDGLMIKNKSDIQWKYGDASAEIFVLLKEGADEEAFMKKIEEIKDENIINSKCCFKAIHLHEKHKLMPSDNSKMRTTYEHIRIFSFAGMMVIICALFNYLVLFITRLKMRGRELGLRKVNGATNGSLMRMLLIEFGLVLLFALFLGECMLEISLPFFFMVSHAQMSQSEIYKETLLFAGILYAITLLLCAFPIYYFKRKSLYGHLHSKTQSGIRNTFQKVMLTSQLVMSAIMIFATTVFFLQVSYLHSRNMGYSFHNLLYPCNSPTPATTKFEQLPFVDKAIKFRTGFPSIYSSGSTKIKKAGDTSETDKMQPEIFHYFADFRLFEMFSLKLLEGRIYRQDEVQAVVISESARNLLKKYNIKGNLLDGFQIVGVVADCYDSPFSTPVPVMYRNINHEDCKSYDLGVLLKMKEGTMDNRHDKYRAQDEINDVFLKEGPSDPSLYTGFYDLEENFENQYLTSVKNLRNLFSIVSIICLLISIFGIYSLASLTCEQRRKEIAIRKINGATMKNILNLFFKEFFLLLGIALVIAFPIGYYAMNLWLEQYTRRVPMGLPLFLGVALSLALVIVASIFLRVWRAASSNPAEVVKENN